MKIRVYQSDDRYVMFENSLRVKRRYGCIPGYLYRLVFEGEVPGNSLEDVWEFMNADDRPNPTSMRSLSRSDVVQIVECDPNMYSAGACFFCDTFGWTSIESDSFFRDDPVCEGKWINTISQQPEETVHFRERACTKQPISVEVLYEGSASIFVRTRIVEDGDWQWDGDQYWDEPIKWRVMDAVSVIPDGALFVNTPKGLLVSEIRSDSVDLGFVTSAVDRHGHLIPINAMLYNNPMESLYAWVWDNPNDDNPTHKIEITR